MTWIPLLLADPSPCLRWLVLRELLGKPDDDPKCVSLPTCACPIRWSRPSSTRRKRMAPGGAAIWRGAAVRCG